MWANVPLAIVVDELECNASRVLARIGFAGMVESSSCAATVVEMVKTMLRDARRDLNAAAASETSEGAVARHLTARESDIMRLLRAGGQNKSIAYQLGISESTVKVHLRRLMLKFNAHNRTQLAIGARDPASDGLHH